VSTDDAAFVYETTIATTPERLWQALTSGEVTRAYWFDRRIESEWSVGSPVTFYDGESDVVTDVGTVVECEPPWRLVYTFAQVGGATTRVAFDLEPQQDGVRLRLVHDELADPGDVEGWRRGWTPILTNLQALLEGRTPESAPARTSRIETDPPTLTRRIPRPPAEVLHALTDAELMGRWWVPEGASTVVNALDTRPGGALSLTVTLAGGQVVELRGTYREVGPDQVVHTFRAEGDPTESIVTWRMVPDGRGTILELIESGVTDEYRRDSEPGWAEGVDKLVDLLAHANAR
jgi:uncharacterized protein YndB with AHSA1/START domain